MLYTSLLSIDYGTRKSGLAYSVEGFAFAWKTIESKGMMEVLKKSISEKKIETIIIGMPYNIDGTMSKQGQRVKQFQKILEKEINIPIVLHDERLTTSEARFGLSDLEDGDIDAEAARLILEDYINTLGKHRKIQEMRKNEKFEDRS